ncbi:MAG: hypothetical protein JWR69_3277 [Pedosphaera sp.]|nr:hypothetical protein [Pedosphaera sp.]
MTCAGTSVRACLWDATTLKKEQGRHPQIAEVILGQAAKTEDAGAMRQRIKDLSVSRHEEDPDWWNNLAGAHIRLGNLKEAVELLEPAVKRFPDDYGVHANLGTAYHLLGRYADAEREIARDLEINPDAHFGLEKYHLALLQYLIRDAGYRSRHLYVDEFTSSVLLGSPAYFFGGGSSIPPSTNIVVTELANMESEYRDVAKTNHDWKLLGSLLNDMVLLDNPPPYRAMWDLEEDPKLEDGLIYMATMNPKEPACYQMLGVICTNKRDQNLAVAAFEKAITLGSPQSEILSARVEELQRFIRQSQSNKRAFKSVLWMGPVLVLAGCVVAYYGFRFAWFCVFGPEKQK